MFLPLAISISKTWLANENTFSTVCTGNSFVPCTKIAPLSANANG